MGFWSSCNCKEIMAELRKRIEICEKFIKRSRALSVTEVLADLTIPESDGPGTFTLEKAREIVEGGAIPSSSVGTFDIEQGVIREIPLLGELSKKYESGRSGSGTVSSGRGDPGGVSYGTYQLASNPGTCAEFVRQMKYTRYFKGTKPGSKAFSAKWRLLAKESAADESGSNDTFAAAQHEFIKRTHFDPVRKYATSLGIVKNHAVDQVLWSMGVQHGLRGNKSMQNRVVKGLKKIVGTTFIPSAHPKSVINALYDERTAYVKRLRRMQQRTKNSLVNRYKKERKDALAMV